MPKRASLNQAGVRRRSSDSQVGSYLWANAGDAIEGKGAAHVGAIMVKSRTKLPMINGLMSLCIS